MKNENNIEEKIKEQISKDLKRLSEPLKRINSFLLASIIGIYIIASIILLLIVIAHKFEDWYMYLLLEVLIFSFLMLYSGANLKGKMVVTSFFYIIVTFLLLFFIFIISDKIIPAKSVKKEISVLYFPVGIFFLSVGLLSTHLVLSFLKKLRF